MIELYTDGSSLGNPGPGGYGVVLRYKEKEKRFSQGFRNTTNNRMELMAVIEGLKALKRKDIPVTVYSDSKYVVDAIEKGWLRGWKAKGFKKTKNPDLWIGYLKASDGYDIRFKWVKGHAGNKYNEICDQLAVEAAKGSRLLIDQGYESSKDTPLGDF